VSEYVGQTFQLRLRIYSEKWNLLKPLMWNPFISGQKTNTSTDFVADGIQANSLNVLEGYRAPIIIINVGFVYTIIVFHVFSWKYLICYGKFYLFL
jgi:hypothetical protein